MAAVRSYARSEERLLAEAQFRMDDDPYGRPLAEQATALNLTPEQMATQIRQAEDAILNFYLNNLHLSPEFRSTVDLERELGLSRPLVQSLLLRYNLDDALANDTGPGLRIYSRVQHVARRRQSAEWRRFLEQSLLRFSVRELTAELRRQGGTMTEGELYQQLFRHDMSLSRLWERRLPAESLGAVRERLRALGVTLPPDLTRLIDIAGHLRTRHRMDFRAIAGTLGVGAEAVENALHFARIEPHGRTWTDAEETLLRDQYEHRTVRELADALQRTEASVQAKAGELNLTATHHFGRADVTLPLYGIVKAGGFLQREALEAFLWDNTHRSDEEVAADLDVTAKTVLWWRAKLGIRGPGALAPTVPRILPAISETAEERRLRFDRYTQQRATVAATVQWLKDNPGRVPSATDFRPSGSGGRIPFDYARVVGGNVFAAGGRYEQQAIFSSTSQFWLAVKGEATRAGVPFRIYDLTRLTDPSPAAVTELRTEGADAILDWMAARNGQIPKFQTDFGRGEGKIGISESRYFATLHDSPEAAWLTVRNRARVRGIPFRLLDLRIHEFSDAFRTELQREAVELLRRYRAERGVLPNSLQIESDLGLSYDRLVGIGVYRPASRVTVRSHVFPTPEALWEAVDAD